MSGIKNGFTVIELLMVIMIAAIVGIVAAPRLFKASSSIGVAAFTKKIRDDIRYAQSSALLRSNHDTPNSTNPTFYFRIRFNIADVNCPGANQYTIVNDANNNGTWGENPNSSVVESVRNPSTGSQYFCVQMDSGDYAGFTVSANFGGSVPGIVEFDNSGIPYDSDGVKIAAAKTLTVSRNGETGAVTLTPNTGMVTVQ